METVQLDPVQLDGIITLVAMNLDVKNATYSITLLRTVQHNMHLCYIYYTIWALFWNRNLKVEGQTRAIIVQNSGV